MKKDTFWAVSLITLTILGLAHLFLWLLTKGIIWVMYTLFHLDWYQHFWTVLVLLLIVHSIFGSFSFFRKK